MRLKWISSQPIGWCTNCPSRWEVLGIHYRGEAIASPLCSELPLPTVIQLFCECPALDLRETLRLTLLHYLYDVFIVGSLYQQTCQGPAVPIAAEKQVGQHTCIEFRMHPADSSQQLHLPEYKVADLVPAVRTCIVGRKYNNQFKREQMELSRSKLGM